MENYFADIPIYKIWITIIEHLTPKSSFIITELNYRFVDLVCNREGLTDTYIKKNLKLKLIYAQEYRSFFCELIDIETNSIVNWRQVQPTIKKNIVSLSELEIEIDTWMKFLKTELY